MQRLEQFRNFFQNAPDSPNRFPVTALAAEDLNLLSAKNGTVWLSRISLDQHLKSHPEVGFEDYAKISDIIQHGDIWRELRPNRFTILGLGYRAALKVVKTNDDGEIWFLTLFKNTKQKPPKGAVLLRGKAP